MLQYIILHLQLAPTFLSVVQQFILSFHPYSKDVIHVSLEHVRFVRCLCHQFFLPLTHVCTCIVPTQFATNGRTFRLDIVLSLELEGVVVQNQFYHVHYHFRWDVLVRPVV